MVTLFIVTILGTLISSLTGLGGGTILLAALTLMYPPEVAIPLHAFTQLMANLFRTGLSFKKVEWDIVWRYFLLQIPGAWLGGLLFAWISSSLLNVMIGSFLILSIFFSERVFKKIQISKQVFIPLGFVSGFLGMFVGAVGPILNPFFNALKLNRDSMIATKSASQFILQCSKILAFFGAAGWQMSHFREDIFWLVTAALAGVLISYPIGKKIPDSKLDLMINIILGLIGAKILWDGITGLM